MLQSTCTLWLNWDIWLCWTWRIGLRWSYWTSRTCWIRWEWWWWSPLSSRGWVWRRRRARVSIFQFTEVFSIIDARGMRVLFTDGSLHSWRSCFPWRILISIEGFLWRNNILDKILMQKKKNMAMYYSEYFPFPKPHAEQWKVRCQDQAGVNVLCSWVRHSYRVSLCSGVSMLSDIILGVTLWWTNFTPRGFRK